MTKRLLQTTVGVATQLLAVMSLIVGGLHGGAAPATGDANQTAHAMPAPPVPQTRTRTAYFRELLRMTSDARDLELAKKPAPQQAQLRAKVQEYLAYPTLEREARLQVMELHEHFRSLVRANATERDRYLSQLPPAHGALLQRRLAEWEQLAPELRRTLLEYEPALPYLLKLGGASAADTSAWLASLPPQRRSQLEQQLAAWNSMPDDQRRNLSEGFERFFELSSRKKSRTMNALSENDRQRLARLVESFDRLPADERRLCLASVRRFANLTAEERARFLRNAERWQAMSASERKVWQSLVSALPPPPPGAASGFGTGSVSPPSGLPRPPIPGVARTPPQPPVVATNRKD